jgi:hypothetical protein
MLAAAVDTDGLADVGHRVCSWTAYRLVADDLDGPEEADLLRLLEWLDEYRADVEKRSAVLVAKGEDVELVGAWNREGASVLSALLPLPEARGTKAVFRRRLSSYSATRRSRASRRPGGVSPRPGGHR